MTTEMRQQRTPNRVVEAVAGGDDNASGLATIRADVDRIVAAAADVFERTRATNSEEFMRRSRQTGGQ